MYKPTVKLVGEDGNVFSIIAKVGVALRQEGMKEQADEFKTKALASESYNEVLRLVLEYVDVE